MVTKKVQWKQSHDVKLPHSRGKHLQLPVLRNRCTQIPHRGAKPAVWVHVHGLVTDYTEFDLAREASAFPLKVKGYYALRPLCVAFHQPLGPNKQFVRAQKKSKWERKVESPSGMSRKVTA